MKKLLVLVLLSILSTLLFAEGDTHPRFSNSAFVNKVLHKDTLSQQKTKVYRFNIRREIGPAIWRQTNSAFDEAELMGADYFVINMNTYGGAVLQADSIRTKILNSKIPVYVLIDNNAASAGALISIACDKIYMRKGASIGAATVVNQTGAAMPDKYQSYMRSIMRATAETHGRDTIITGTDTIYRWKRDPLIAEALVDQRLALKGIIDTGKVLTFTPQEAIKHGFCEGMAENIPDMLKAEGVEYYEIAHYRATALENTIGVLVNPILQGILIMIIVGGIYFELQTPGVGFPILASLTAALVYFAPLYLEGLAANYEIIIFAIGVLLLAAEVFVIPGFGLAGILGVIGIITGLTLAMVDNYGFSLESDHIGMILNAVGIVTLSSFVSIVLSIILTKKLLENKQWPLALHAEESLEGGYVGVDASVVEQVGMTGIVLTDLRPSGKVMINEQVYDAVSLRGSFVEKGSSVKVVKYEAGQVYVVILE